jgi:hypothetical protein
VAFKGTKELRMPKLPPWTYGPFELLVNAETHLRAGEDFDRRLALISFDNAVEVAITTFLTLHPIQRNGKMYRNDDVEKWLANYHSRLDFLDTELKALGQEWTVERSYIVWAHSQRNEQYHAGNQGVPDKRCLGIAKQAALWVFGMLFGVSDAEAELNAAVAQKLPQDRPKRNKSFDQAIDNEFGTIAIGECLYSASEVVSSLDYDAYREIGTELCGRMNGDGNQEDDDDHPMVQ